MPLNPDLIRKDFPVLQQARKGRKLVYFDNACMSLRPEQVVSKIVEYYRGYPGCAGRSYHYISRKTTEEVQKAREAVQKFIRAKKPEEIVFTKNTTEGLNLVCHSLPVKKGDVVLTTDKEHNSGLLPVQALVRDRGVSHVVVPSGNDGMFSLEKFEELINANRGVKLVSMVATSNLDGTTIPVKEVAGLAHDAHALLLLDGAQFVPHHEVDVMRLGADFLAFSGHKMMGPSGIGVLYGREGLLNSLPPFIAGGETVFDTTYGEAKFEKSPHRFEAGLQHYSGIIGLGEAVRYLSKIGFEGISANELAINRRISGSLLSESAISVIGPAEPRLRGSIFSFNIKGVSPHDVAVILDSSANIAIRSGAHCVHSWFNAHGISGSARASFYAYNTVEEADVFVDAVRALIVHVKK